ncbi:inositol monophosphatase [Corynebacterium breve]|uniref:Inositol monophosphatase n=1 Tax=Corynebacterium breve TaxID=3049799 RepID=A0ABY8VBS8_9CORY|nr:inositol monophosphatase [Corynebacterium breve]WIM66928.1 inositol monophosphatase [Corynebacterium breve]
MVNPQAMLQTAHDVIREASEMFVAGVGAAPVLYKKHGDFATEADLNIEKMIRRRLEAETGIPVFGEEQGGTFEPDACWIIDPIDGTTNYAAGNPNCAILLSLIVNNEPVVAITDMPLMNMTMSTTVGQPVILNGKELPPLVDEPSSNALVGVGSVGSPDSQRFPARYRLKLIGWLSDTDLRPRITGSVGVDLAFVAQGVFSAALSFSPHVWDNSAGVLLARNAGAKVTDGLGGEWHPTSLGVIAAPPKAHATVMDTIAEITNTK